MNKNADVDLVVLGLFHLSPWQHEETTLEPFVRPPLHQCSRAAYVVVSNINVQEIVNIHYDGDTTKTKILGLKIKCFCSRRSGSQRETKIPIVLNASFRRNQTSAAVK